MTKFQWIWSRIVDFSLIANFEASLRFYLSVFTYNYLPTNWHIELVKLNKDHYIPEVR